MQIIVITGPPYSGKGTQCEVLETDLDFIHVSTGDRCRMEKDSRTKIGLEMARYEERGDLVPDSTMKELFNEILEENRDSKGIILDGYPRTQNQVNDLLDLTASKGMTIKKVLNIKVPLQELLSRARKRAETSDRMDDKDPSIHIKRINVFEEKTRPAIELMKTVLPVMEIDGLRTVEAITKAINDGL